MCVSVSPPGVYVYIFIYLHYLIMLVLLVGLTVVIVSAVFLSSIRPITLHLGQKRNLYICDELTLISSMRAHHLGRVFRVKRSF